MQCGLGGSAHYMISCTSRGLNVLLSAIHAERNAAVRQSIQDVFIATADSLSLATLAEQNRFIQARVEAAMETDLDAFGAVVWPARWTIAEGDYFRPWSPEDSLLRSAYDDLGWNIGTLIQSLNHLRVVRNVDLSQVMLSRPIPVGDESIHNPTWDLETDDPAFAPGIQFIEVNLSGASLAGITLRQATFREADMDSVNLAGTEFYESVFDRGTLRDFFVWASTFPGAAQVLAPPLWAESKLEPRTFQPAMAIALVEYFRLWKSEWVFPDTVWSARTGEILAVPQRGVSATHDARAVMGTAPAHPRQTVRIR